jgi:hypothetical protein
MAESIFFLYSDGRYFDTLSLPWQEDSCGRSQAPCIPRQRTTVIFGVCRSARVTYDLMPLDCSSYAVNNPRLGVFIAYLMLVMFGAGNPILWRWLRLHRGNSHAAQNSPLSTPLLPEAGTHLKKTQGVTNFQGVI